MKSFTQYIVKEFEEKAETSDRMKVAVYTLFDTTLSTLLSVQGVVSFFNIKGIFIPAVLITIFSMGYFNLFRLWYTCRTFVYKESEKKEGENGINIY